MKNETGTEDRNIIFCLKNIESGERVYERFSTANTTSGWRDPAPDPAASAGGSADCNYEIFYISGKRRVVLDRMRGSASVYSENKKNRICGGSVADLRISGDESSSEKSGGTTASVCGDRGVDPACGKANRLFFSVRTYDSFLCGSAGYGADAAKEDWNTGSDRGCAGGFFQVVSGCALSDRCTGWFAGGSSGKHIICVVCAEKI